MRIIIILFTTLFLIYDGYAYNVVATGRATIKNDKLRDAYNGAIYNAKLTSIKWYYKENKIYDIDVNSDFFKFIKSYTILEQNIENNSSVYVKLKIDLDDIALQDARLLLNQHADSTVYLYRGIDESVVPTKQIQSIITNTLTTKQFSLSNQSSFMNKISNINDDKAILKAFKEVDSASLILFDFIPINTPEEIINKDYLCEIKTTVSIYDKKNNSKSIQIITGSDDKNMKKCYDNSIKQASIDTVAYIRENIIQLPETAAELRKYNINFINIDNLVLTKNIVDTLSQRGLIKSYKTLSYSQKNVVFEVDSYFSTSDLSNKIRDLKLTKKPSKIEFNDKKIVLDFSIE